MINDLALAIGLAKLCHEELESFGTGGGEQIGDSDIDAAQRTLRAVLSRLGIDLVLPWRNFSTFKNHWKREGCANSYQARRDLLAGHFEQLHAQLAAMEDHSPASNLAEPVGLDQVTGWPRVDGELQELRRRFRNASSPEDYRAVGGNCVGVMEALSAAVYDAAVHLRDNETEPPVDKTNLRIDRFVEDALAGPENEHVRGLVKKAAALAHSVKHRRSSRRDAGIASDSVILLASILRRIDQE